MAFHFNGCYFVCKLQLYHNKKINRLLIVNSKNIWLKIHHTTLMKSLSFDGKNNYTECLKDKRVSLLLNEKNNSVCCFSQHFMILCCVSKKNILLFFLKFLWFCDALSKQKSTCNIFQVNCVFKKCFRCCRFLPWK